MPSFFIVFLVFWILLNLEAERRRKEEREDEFKNTTDKTIQSNLDFLKLSEAL